MGTLKKEYRDLETKVLATLREMVNNSKKLSKHTGTKIVKIEDSFGYAELSIINDNLAFIDSKGYHYKIWGVCTLEDLIDIIEKHKS